MLNSGLDESLGLHVYPQVHHFDALALHHHLHQVLADVVQVALDSAQHHHAQAFRPLLSQQGLEQSRTGVHGPGSHQHLGHKDLVSAEFDPHPVHAGQQPFGQDLLGGVALLQCLLDILDYQFFLALFQGVADFN